MPATDAEDPERRGQRQAADHEAAGDGDDQAHRAEMGVFVHDMAPASRVVNEAVTCDGTQEPLKIRPSTR